MAMMEGGLDIFLQGRLFRSGESPVQETFSDIVHGLCGRMAHVFCIKAVVAKLVQDDFVCWEIIGGIEWSHAEIDRKSGHEFFDAEQECGFAYLVFMGSILEMTDRADGEYELLPGTSFGGAAELDHPVESGDYLVTGEAESQKVRCRLLEAV